MSSLPLCCLPWCRKPIPNRKYGRQFPTDRPSQLEWLDALELGTWFSIPPETLTTGLILCGEHFDRKGNIKRRYELPFNDAVVKTEPMNSSSESEEEDEEEEISHSTLKTSGSSRTSKEFRINIVRMDDIDDVTSSSSCRETKGEKDRGRKRQAKASYKNLLTPEFDSSCSEKNEDDDPTDAKICHSPSKSHLEKNAVDLKGFWNLGKEGCKDRKKSSNSKTATRQSLNLLQKMEVIRLMDQGLKQSQIARRFDLRKSTVWSVITKREVIEEAYNSGAPLRKKLRKGTYDDINSSLYAWYQSMVSQNLYVNTKVLTSMAENIASELGRTDFKGSQGWLERFKQRYNIRFNPTAPQKKRRRVKPCEKLKKDVTGISGHSAASSCFSEMINQDEDAEVEFSDDNESEVVRASKDWLKYNWEEYRVKTVSTQEHFDDKDIFFLKEVSLLYRITPKQAWQFRHDTSSVSEFSLADERITVLLCSNGDGSVKRKLLIVGTNPVKLPINSPVDYAMSSDSANLLTQPILRKWLKLWNDSLESENRKILLLLDSSPIHTLGNVFTNIKLINIPTHIVSLIHPANQGISSSFRARYRRLLLEKMVAVNCSSLGILQIIFLLQTAWNEVPSSIVKAGFLKPGLTASGNPISTEEQIDCSNLQSKAAELGLAVSSSKFSFLEYVGIDNWLYAVGCEVVSKENVTTENFCKSQTIKFDENDVFEESSQNASDLSVKLTVAEAQKRLEDLRQWAMSKDNCPENVHGALSTLYSFIRGH